MIEKPKAAKKESGLTSEQFSELERYRRERAAQPPTQPLWQGQGGIAGQQGLAGAQTPWQFQGVLNNQGMGGVYYSNTCTSTSANLGSIMQNNANQQ